MAPRAALLSAILLVGCFPPGEGIEPPGERVYFPVGLAVDEEKNFLYVVNSDFDLQFNAGTVQSWDLNELRRRMPSYCESNADCQNDPNGRTECDTQARDANLSVPSNWCVEPGGSPCGWFGHQSDREQSLYPGRCQYINPVNPQDGGGSILPEGAIGARRAVVVGAFATDVVRRTRPVAPLGWTVDDGPGGLTDGGGDVRHERLFVPVRGDATLHWLDVDRGLIECGQDLDNGGACNAEHRAGDRAEAEGTRGEHLGPEPFGIDADERGLTLLVTNQTSGAVGLFSHRRTAQNDIVWSGGPRFAFREGGLPDRPIGVANVPIPLALPSSGRERLPGYLVSFRSASVVFLLRVYDDAAADPARPYTQSFESQGIFTNSSGVDSRGLAVDAFARKTEEQRCIERFGIDPACARTPLDPSCPEAAREAGDDTFQGCLERAAAKPLDVFVSNRAPASLVLGRSQPRLSDSVTSDLPQFRGNVPLDIGPSRVFMGEIVNEQGERERRVFVVCFDSRRIAVYDPERDRLETEIVTGRGPHAFAVDVTDDHAYAYVGHFLDSYIGVVDLDQRHRGMYGALIASVAKPTPPRSSK